MEAAFEVGPLFNRLPDECTLLIFSLFEVKDLLTSGLVCKNWLRLCRDDGLWKKLCERCWQGLELLSYVSIDYHWIEYFQRRKKLEKFNFDFGELALREEELEEKKDSYKWKLWKARHRRMYTFFPTNRHLRQKYSLEEIRQRCNNPMENTNDLIMLLEAILQKDPLNSEAWTLLGRAHADNDEDSKAIECLVNAVTVQADNSIALMLLGISCTNEAELRLAEYFLRGWLAVHPIYNEACRAMSSGDLALKQVFTQLERAHPHDTNLKLVLGVLCCGVGEFDSAVELFKQALYIDPLNYSLWNKLGATLANTNQNKSAEESYKRALMIKPNYVRGLVNMGTCLTNSRNYEASFEAYLQALKLNENAAHIWGYMRIGAFQRNDSELIAKIDAQNLTAFVHLPSKPLSIEQLSADPQLPPFFPVKTKLVTAGIPTQPQFSDEMGDDPSDDESGEQTPLLGHRREVVDLEGDYWAEELMGDA